MKYSVQYLMRYLMRYLVHPILILMGIFEKIHFRIFRGAEGKLSGKIFYWFGFRRSVMEKNLSRAFPSLSREELESLVNQNYQHFSQLLFEFIRSFSVMGFRNFLEREVRCEGEQHLREALSEGRGAFVMTAHLGNWEVLPAHGTHVLGVPVTMVTKTLKPSWLHDIVESTRLRLGTRMAFEPKTMKIVMKALKNKEVVGFAIDQFAGAPVGARVPFFGTPVGSHTALATLALRTGSPVVPGLAIRNPDGGFTVRFEPKIQTIRVTEASPGYASARAEEVIRNTAAYTAWVEERVRKNPEQWLWIHRRWKGDLSPLPSKVLGEMLK